MYNYCTFLMIFVTECVCGDFIMWKFQIEPIILHFNSTNNFTHCNPKHKFRCFVTILLLLRLALLCGEILSQNSAPEIKHDKYQVCVNTYLRKYLRNTPHHITSQFSRIQIINNYNFNRPTNKSAQLPSNK